MIELAPHDVVGIRADNPGPFTLSGTNSWIFGRDPAWLIDPGPRLDDHLAAVEQELNLRGGLAGILLTHDHRDHSEAVDEIRARFPRASLLSAQDRGEIGPFEVIATPGHAPDHVAYLAGRVAFTGDAVLGKGSVFISPDPGALAGYLEGLDRLRARDIEIIAPGHGPPVPDPQAKLDEYIAHRLDRERRLIAALDDGLRSADELLDQVWDDAPHVLRPAAAVTLAAHLDKLEDEGRLPAGVERPDARF